MKTSCTRTHTRYGSSNSTKAFTMIIGANLAAIIYEIGVVEGATAVVIVYAMRAREKFLR